MKLVTPIFAATLMMAGAGQVQAAGCIKGAIIGGVAGHYLANRGVVGAVAGCLGGRALANRSRNRQVEYDRRGPRGGDYGDNRRGGGYDRGYDQGGYQRSRY